MFIRNCWYVAAWDEEISADGFHTISIIDEPLLIYRTADGTLVAMEDRCCHRSAPLSKGRLEDGCNLRCMYHGLKFAPDGRCIEIPGQDMIPDTAWVRTYPVVSRHDWIWVWMGDPALADEALIPPAVARRGDGFVLGHGNIDYAANYQLINDNLTDLSHVSYVHANSFGATEYYARRRPLVKPIERGIRITRWVAAHDDAMSENAVTVKMRPKDVGPTAMYQTYDFLAPGVLLMYMAIFRREDMPADGVSRSTGEPVMANMSCQAVTPMDARSSRYFFSWGPREQDGGEEAAERLMVAARQAFAEDRAMIEAQQAIIDRRGPGRDVLTSADVGPVQMRAVIRKLHRAEQPTVEPEPAVAAPDSMPV